MDRKDVEGVEGPKLVEELPEYRPKEIRSEPIVSFRICNAGLGYHPSVPPGTAFFHPSSLVLLSGFVVEGDVVEIKDSPFEVLSSPLSLPPVIKYRDRLFPGDDPQKVEDFLKKGARVHFFGGVLLPGKNFVPPLPLSEERFRSLVEAFKSESEEQLLGLGITPREEYLRLLGPFFGYHVPNAVQMLEEEEWKNLYKRWGGTSLPEAELFFSLLIHRSGYMVETGVHGTYPIFTPSTLYVCPQGHLSPLPYCPLCGKPTKEVKICPNCRRTYTEGEKCPVDGTKLVNTYTFDPKPVLDQAEKRFGRVGNVNISDGPPEHPLKAYFRKKTNLNVGPSGAVEIDIPVFPGEENAVPARIVDLLLRIYRFLSYTLREVFQEEVGLPSTKEEIVGRRMVLHDGSVGFSFVVEGFSDRLTLRKSLFYTLPTKYLNLSVFEDVLWNSRLEYVVELQGRGEDFPYYPFPGRSLFDENLDRYRLIDLYNDVIARMDADPGLVIPLLHPILKEIEAQALSTPVYVCKDCGAEYPRLPLNGKCPRCGGRVEIKERISAPSLDPLLERWRSNPKIYTFLSHFKRRLGGQSGQSGIMDFI